MNKKDVLFWDIVSLTAPAICAGATALGYGGVAYALLVMMLTSTAFYAALTLASVADARHAKKEREKRREARLLED